MLVNLNISDLAVVKTLDIDLNKGMSVLTGETGAGKSILLTALGLALGDRADSGYIRPEADRAEINLTFDLSHVPQARQWLTDNELDAGDECLIRRIVADDGRSKAYINNRPVTLLVLQELSEMLVQIHGQHAHLTLLQGDEQRRLLDAYGKNQDLLDKVNDCYRQWRLVSQELENLTKANQNQQQREDFLRYQIDELQQLDLQQYNYQSLSDEHAKLANLENILAIGLRHIDNLYENDQVSVNQMLNHSIAEISQITQYAPELGDICSLLSEAQIQAEEAALQLRRFIQSQQADPARMSMLENQLGIIQKLSRKHQVSPETLPELAQNLAQELESLNHSGERLATLTAQTEHFLGEFNRLSAELTKRRQEEALVLGRQITAVIQELGMPQGQFQVNCTPNPDGQPRLNGKDKVEFLVCANPGLPAKPLAKVASGGELSRISLAIQVSTANDDATPTMIFDEVDAGIGGGTAEIVGQKLRRLGQGRQVLCVTHLPQVAAQAHSHLYVEKSNKNDMTATSVKPLDGEARVAEIARMLGGLIITENTRNHAREMLETCKEKV